ncbi:MAG: DUF1330 domain-containing protein [Rhodospirillales bacterium]|nr:DUF1330 domain-containing protein [Alphaproteobacteria bacterium]MCY4431723.1 DUF1330 domain-containing protein [Rhodospirillales bacterium]
MAAYIIGRIEITNSEAYKEYAAKVPETVQRHGGRYLVRGGASEVLEGAMPDRRTVCLEFADREAALGWYNSPEYVPLRELRLSASVGDLFVVDGI